MTPRWSYAAVFVVAGALAAGCGTSGQESISSSDQSSPNVNAPATAAENYKEDVNPLFLTNDSKNTVWVSFEDGDQNVEFPPGAKKRARGKSAVITGDGGAVLIRLKWDTTGFFDFWWEGDGDPYIMGYGASGNRCFRRVPTWGQLPDDTVACDARNLKLGYDQGKNYGSPGEDWKLAAVLEGDNWTW